MEAIILLPIMWIVMAAIFLLLTKSHAGTKGIPKDGEQSDTRKDYIV
tara:strand:- start:1593 stop:1733 length:141 start_codon:yes stop_codon:yes gene_type:complete